jgi:putative SOS response-associated peptidase YedK
MCNLYTVRKSAEEVAAHFGVTAPSQFNAAGEVYPGSTGMVVRQADGRRMLQAMTWGFPMRFKFMKPDSKPKAVNNIADLQKGTWKGLANKPQWRCLIPLTEFWEAEGTKGAMTRTGFRIKGHPVFAWGGLWRQSDEWGAVYSGSMTNCNAAIKPVHDRMPVLLLPHEYDTWLNGSFDDLLAFQERCFPDELIEMERTAEPWVRKKTATDPAPAAGQSMPEAAL